MSKTTRQFKRQFFGYRRSAVDDHLATVDASIADLRDALDRAAHPDHQDLVLRATRRAVEDVMQRAHDDATRLRDEAAAEAAAVLADAYAIAQRRDDVIDLRPAGVADDDVIDADDLEDDGLEDDDEIDLAAPSGPHSAKAAADAPVDALDELLDSADGSAAEGTGRAAASMGSLEDASADPDWNADLAKVIND